MNGDYCPPDSKGAAMKGPHANKMKSPFAHAMAKKSNGSAKPTSKKMSYGKKR